MDGLIHYPTMELPDDAWTSTALLYWDRVATILPPEAMEAPDSVLSEFTLGLLREDLVEALPVADVDGTSFDLIERASQRFLSYLAVLPGDRLSERRAAFQHGSQTPLYKGKATWDLFERLASEGLRQGEIVEKATADDYLAVLACSFASELSAQGERWVVGTGSEHSMLGLLAPSAGRTPAEVRIASHASKVPVERLVLERLFPAPREPLTIDEILEFRRKYGGLLGDLRRHVELRIAAFRNADSEEERQDLLDDLERQCEIEARGAEDALRLERVTRVRRSKLVAFLKKAVPGGEAVDAAVPILFGESGEVDRALAYALFYRASFGPGRRRVRAGVSSPLH